MEQTCWALFITQLGKVIELNSEISSYRAPENQVNFWEWIDEYKEYCEGDFTLASSTSSTTSRMHELLEFTAKSRQFEEFVKMIDEQMKVDEDIMWKIEQFYKITTKNESWGPFLFSTLGGLFDECGNENVLNAWNKWAESHEEGWTLPFKTKV